MTSKRTRSRKRAEPRLEPTRRDAVETRTRLLEAAREAFAEHGFHHAGLREVCDAAGVNLGAVKYYFGSKESLYREVLIDSHRQLVAEEPIPRLADAADPEAALRAWIGYFLRLVLVRRTARPFMARVLLQELAQPTPALDDLVTLVMKPIRGELESIVRALVGRRADRARVGRLTNLVVLLCVQHEFGRPVLERFGYPVPTRAHEVDELAEHLFRFALAGIRGETASGKR